MKGFTFQTDSYLKKYVKHNPVDRSHYGYTALRDYEILNYRYPDSYYKYVYTLESCTRHCLLTPGCDMFHYTQTYCYFYPYENRKLSNIYDVIFPTTSSNNDIYLLHCAPTSENLVINNDFFTHSTAGWTFDESNTCTFKLTQNDQKQYMSKHAVHGWYKFTMLLECSEEHTFAMEQEITQYPWKMNGEYFQIVKPKGYFRYWYKSKSDQSVEHDVGFTLELIDAGGATLHTIGKPLTKIHTKAMTQKSLLEELWILPELPANLQKAKVKMEFISAKDSTKMFMGPMEVVIDIPFHAGCYEILTDLSETPIINDLNHPSWCITECLKADVTKRFARNSYKKNLKLFQTRKH